MHFFDVVQAIALDFASRRRACKLIPSQTASARSSMDRASDYGSEGWGFESLRARSGPPRCDPPVGVLHFYQALFRECFFMLISRLSRSQQVGSRLSRDKVRPTLPLQWYFREKIRPARQKPLILGCFERAGRFFSRSGVHPCRAGRVLYRLGAGVEGAVRTGGPGCGARGRWRGLAGLRDDTPISDLAPLVWRAPEGPEGTGGLRGAAPNEVRP